MNKSRKRTFGYGCVIKTGQSAKKQEAAFEAAGIDRIFIDEVGSEEFDWLLQDHHILGLQPGDEIMLVCEAYLGYPGAVRDKRLRRIAAKGAKVGVIGEDPVLYDTEEKIATFKKLGSKVATGDRMKKLGAGPGKPSKASLTRSEFDILIYFWQNTRAPRMAFIQQIQTCSAKHGKKCAVTDDNLADWLGPREPGDHQPPRGMIKDG